VLVTAGWILMSAIATVPLLIALPGLSFTDAFFETMSGLSTTGATVLVGLDNLPPSINLWRHALNWYGGMGIIVLVVAILPLLGVGGMQVYKAETPGPMKDEKAHAAHHADRPRAVVRVLPDHHCLHRFAEAGRHELVRRGVPRLCRPGTRRILDLRRQCRHFDSPAIEAVLIVFMLIAAMNFSRHFVAWQQKEPAHLPEDIEARTMLW